MRQLLCWLVLLHLLVFCVAVGISYTNFGRSLDSFNDEHIQRLAQAYADTAAGSPAIRRLDGKDVFERGAPIVQIWDKQGHLVASSWRDADLPLLPLQGSQLVQTGVGARHAWRVHANLASADGGRVQIAQSERFLRRVVARRALGAALPVALMLPVTLALLSIVVWRTSHSLRRIASEIAGQDERSASDLARVQVPKEIEPLVEAFGSLVARLQQAFSAQQRFAQDAAHELRSPIAAIGLQLENLRAYIPSGEAFVRFHRLESGVARARHLIEQLLRLSTAMPGAVSTHDVVDLASLLRESISQHLAQADRRGIDLGFEGEGTVLLCVPAVELRSIFDNLIDNALRYTREFGIVDVRLLRMDDRVVVEVVDDGPGMAAASMARAFDRFFRAPGVVGEGSGLGLAIARAAAERHGLCIELQDRSEIDAGRSGLIARVFLASPSALTET